MPTRTTRDAGESAAARVTHETASAESASATAGASGVVDARSRRVRSKSGPEYAEIGHVDLLRVPFGSS